MRGSLRLFLGKGQWLSCHNGPLLTELRFHNTGVPPRDDPNADAGRLKAIGKLRAAVRHSELRPLRGEGREPIRLSARDKLDLVAFLKAL